MRLIAYHAQQCAEKSLKAVLVLQGIDFPYTHDLSRLIRLCPKDASWIPVATKAESLTIYAAATRYPGGELEVTRREAVASVKVASRLRTLICEDIVHRVREQHGRSGLAILALDANVKLKD